MKLNLRGNDKNNIDLIYQLLQHKILKHISSIRIFPKDDKNILYVTHLTKTYSSIKKVVEIIGFGYSFFSPKQSLIKSLGEAIERYASYWREETEIVSSPYSRLQKDALDPFYYENTDSVRHNVFKWVKGHNITTNRFSLIPAQLVYINYLDIFQEPKLSPGVVFGSGGAFGLNHEQTLLSGIYELIERDVLMTVYLNNFSTAKIDITSLPYSFMKKINRIIEVNKINLSIFNITNDLNIPTFLSIVERKNGSFTIGLKSNISYIAAIIGSIEEGFLEKTVNENGLSTKINKLKTHEIITRNKIIKLFLDCKTKRDFNPGYTRPVSASIKELSFIVDNLKKKGFEIFYKNITPQILLPTFLVYKVIIPKLQPLFLTTDQEDLRNDRLKQVGEYFDTLKHS